MCCCMMSPHRFFCRPRLRRPLTSAVIILFMEFSSSLLITCMTVPWQSGLSYFVSNACHPSVFLMTSLLFLSFSETPSIHHSILISVLFSSPSSLSLSLTRLLPHTSVAYQSNHALVYLFFRHFGIFASHKTPARS